VVDLKHALFSVATSPGYCSPNTNDPHLRPGRVS
jgi:hypothetical protein